MKRILSAILAVCMCSTAVLALSSCGCQKDDNNNISTVIEETKPELVDENGFGYIVGESNNLVLLQYTGSAMEFEIPSEYNGMTVTEIKSSVFRNQDIKSVTIPATVEKIGNRAFSNCKKLTNVSFSEGLKEIDNFAFSYCSNLKEVKLPESLTRLGEYAFTASGLEKCNIPSKITELENFVFFQCQNLQSVYVPETVTTFGKDVFGEAENLTITGKAGSPIEEYAKKEKVNFQAEE